MAEKDTLYSSKIKYKGIFNFRDFYSFIHEWLRDETGLSNLNESKYVEKLSGDEKEIEFEWAGSKKMTDYFKMSDKLKCKITQMKDVKVKKDGKELSMNSGTIELSIKGILEKDYQSKFESTPFKKFLRGIYEKWVIPSRVEEYEDKVVEGADTFLSQAKAYLDLEGRK